MGVKGGLRHRVHAVIAAHDRQVNPQRHLDVGVAQPRADHIQRDLPDHQPMPGGTVPQAVSASAPLPGPRRFLFQAGPLDPVADVPERRPHAERHHPVPRRRFAGQLVNSCSNSGCSRTVRAFLVFERRTSRVAGSPR